MRKLNLLALGASTIAFGPMMAANAQVTDLPPNAKPGQCWSRVLAPAQYQNYTETVVVQPASERIQVTPAKYEWVEKRVVVEDAFERLEVIPARFENKTETVIVEPARTEARVVPAKFSTKTERIKVRDAYTTWKKGKGPITKLDQSTGEILCLVEVPAEYREVTQKVLVSPERTEKVTIPAKTSTVTRRVMVQPETTRTVKIPAKSKTVKFKQLVSAASEKRIPIAAVTKEVSHTKKVGAEQLQWAEILCETNLTPNVVTRLQRSLANKGFYNGPIDGDIGAGTMKAVDAFQNRQGLSRGSLTIETLKSLGVSTLTTASLNSGERLAFSE